MCVTMIMVITGCHLRRC